MIFLNAGNLWTHSYLDKVIQLNRQYEGTIQVKSLFGSIAYLTPTARSFDRLPACGLDFARDYIKKAVDNGIAIRYTLNQSCIGAAQDFRAEWDNKLLRAVHKLEDIGVHEWTVTSPLILELLRREFPTNFIEVSTIAEVACVEDAARWKQLGADGVNISTSMNRDLPVIYSVNKILVASVLANEACLYRCPWRRECYNFSSHNSNRSGKLFGYYPFSRCNAIRLAHPHEWLKSRLLLPQWLMLYHQKTKANWFKIAYRTHPESVAIPILEAYMSQQFNGNLCELWPTIAHLGDTPDPKDVTYISAEKLHDLKFINRWSWGDSCGSISCDDCGYCKDTLARLWIAENRGI